MRSSGIDGRIGDQVHDFEIAAFGGAYVAISRNGSSDADQR
jgi:hypothetical protein